MTWKKRFAGAALGCLAMIAVAGCEIEANVTVTSNLAISGEITAQIPEKDAKNIKEAEKAVTEGLPFQSECKTTGPTDGFYSVTCSWPPEQYGITGALDNPQGLQVAREDGDIVFRSWKRDVDGGEPLEAAPVKLTLTMPEEIASAEVNGESVDTNGDQVTVSYDANATHDVVVRSGDPSGEGGSSGGSSFLLIGGAVLFVLACAGGVALYLRRRLY